MSDTDKQYLISKGLNYTNESMHLKKHDINLTLGISNNKTNTFVADQTPTPTRFIRNCEEVGLFQDLQNVNPFDETFRQATEQVKSGNLSAPNDVNISDDTLHTPHVFPIINHEFGSKSGSEQVKSSSSDYELKTPVILKPIAVEKRIDSKREIKAAILKRKKTEPPVVQNILPQPTILTNIVPISFVPTIIPAEAKFGNKIVLPKSQFLFETKPVVQKLNVTKKRQSSKVSVKESEREVYLERNRAAAYRAREKRKQWVDNLVKNNDNLLRQNQALSGENGKLRMEVASLKKMLLAHENCDVTRKQKITNPQVINITIPQIPQNSIFPLEVLPTIIVSAPQPIKTEDSRLNEPVDVKNNIVSDNVFPKRACKRKQQLKLKILNNNPVEDEVVITRVDKSKT